MEKFKIITRKLVLDTPYCPIEHQRVQLPDGSETDWWVNLFGDAVIVVPVLPDGRILYQKNYKHGSGACVLEFCAGMIDAGETPEQAAHRELQEETGYQAKKMIKVGENFSNPTGAKMKYHYFLALDSELISQPDLEPAEQIECHLADNFSALKKTLLATPLTSSGTIGALAYAEAFFQKP